MESSAIVLFGAIGFVLLFFLTILVHSLRHMKAYKDSIGNVESFKLSKKMKEKKS